MSKGKRLQFAASILAVAVLGLFTLVLCASTVYGLARILLAPEALYIRLLKCAGIIGVGLAAAWICSRLDRWLVGRKGTILAATFAAASMVAAAIVILVTSK